MLFARKFEKLNLRNCRQRNNYCYLDPNAQKLENSTTQTFENSKAQKLENSKTQKLKDSKTQKDIDVVKISLIFVDKLKKFAL